MANSFFNQLRKGNQIDIALLRCQLILSLYKNIIVFSLLFTESSKILHSYRHIGQFCGDNFKSHNRLSS